MRHLHFFVFLIFLFTASALQSQTDITSQAVQVNDSKNDNTRQDFSKIDKYIVVRAEQVFLKNADGTEYLFPNPKIHSELLSSDIKKSNLQILMKYMDEFESQYLEDKKIDLTVSPLGNVKNRIKINYTQSIDLIPIENVVHNARYSLMNTIVKNMWATPMLQELSRLKAVSQNFVKKDPEKKRLEKFNLIQKENLPVTIPLIFSLIMNFVCIYLIVSKI